MVRVYKYTGRSSIHKDYYRRYEYEHVDPETGEVLVCYVQTDIHNEKKPLGRVEEVLSDRRSLRYYVGHYDPEKFKEQMQRYREGKIKFRPNGRKWCLLPKDTRFIDLNQEREYDNFVRVEDRFICDN